LDTPRFCQSLRATFVPRRNWACGFLARRASGRLIDFSVRFEFSVGLSSWQSAWLKSSRGQPSDLPEPALCSAARVAIDDYLGDSLRPRSGVRPDGHTRAFLVKRQWETSDGAARRGWTGI